jgi:hypothetical protein
MTELKYARRHLVAAVIVALVLAQLLQAAYLWAGKPIAGDPTGLTGHAQQLVPTTGDQGYPVYEFCSGPLGPGDKLDVRGGLVAAPDSNFVASYTLDRYLGGVHERVEVGVSADPNAQPAGTYYDSANHPGEAFVSKAAMDCIKSKAK